MGDYRTALRRVLCLSGTAAGLVLIEIFLELVMYWREHQVTDGQYFAGLLSVLVFGVVALILPFCGFHGAQNRDPCMVGCFAYCNYCLGCVDCIVVLAFCSLGFVCWAMREVADKCNMVPPPAECDQDLKESMFHVCSTWDEAFRNYHDNSSDMRLRLNTTHVSQLLSEQHCIDTLSVLSTLVLAFVALATVLRCCGVCLHCASGMYGRQLKNMMEDRQYQADSESDSD